jgi:hypothetical protein
MLTNFENIPDLSEAEMLYLDDIINILKSFSKHNPIKGPALVGLINNKLQVKMTEVKLRKFISHIRCHSLLPVIATGKGYFVCYETDELLKGYESLKQRGLKILEDAAGLKYFIPKEQLKLCI